jgi:hypothetical protein
VRPGARFAHVGLFAAAPWENVYDYFSGKAEIRLPNLAADAGCMTAPAVQPPGAPANRACLCRRIDPIPEMLFR